MSDLDEETRFFERLTTRDVARACEQVLPGVVLEISPSMFDAGVAIRHAPGMGPTIEQADRIAEILREGRPLKAGEADWHMSGFGDYCDALDFTRVYGTSFGLRRAFLPPLEALERVNGR